MKRTETVVATLALALAVLVSAAAAGAAPAGRRLKTGAKQCWDANGSAIDCTGTGQDGNLRKGLARSYVDNGDGTITDPQTGLQWEKLDDSDGIHDKDPSYTWDGAFAHVVTLNTQPCFAGRCDWQLPNVNELQSLLDYGKAKPIPDALKTSCTAGCTVAACSCTALLPYWTSSTALYRHEYAWFVDFNSGLLSSAYKFNPNYKVRAVRAG